MRQYGIRMTTLTLTQTVLGGSKKNKCKTSAMQKGTTFRGAMCIPNQFPKARDINQRGIDHALYSVIKDQWNFPFKYSDIPFAWGPIRKQSVGKQKQEVLS